MVHEVARAGIERLSATEAARRHGHLLALISDGASYSFSELHALVRKAARWLDVAAEGSPDGVPRRVAIVGLNRVESVVALEACWELGATPLIVHPKLGPGERARLLSSWAPDVVLDEAFSLSALPPPHDGPPRAPHSFEAPAAILATSGTSGEPKGAVLSHRALVASARGSEENLGWREDDRWLLSMPLAHVGGLSIVTRTLLAGRSTVLATFRGAEPHPLLETIARERITIVSLVPTMLRRIFDAEPNYRFPPHVRAVFLGGAAAPSALLAEARERGVPALTTYGLTEACSQVTTQRLGTALGPEQGSGHPIRGVEVRIEGGEIHVRGDTLMNGYFRGPRAPLDRPFAPDGWFATGDFGEIDDQGRLHVLGRREDRVVSGGENVYPLQVERVLEGFDEIAAACVFGLPDDVWGELVAAAVVPRSAESYHRNSDGFLQRFHEFTRRELAPYQRPRKIAVVDAMVAFATGKPDRRATKDLALRIIARGANTE